MTMSGREPDLHGGPRRIVELAARALGYDAGRATILHAGEIREVATAGPVTDATEHTLEHAAADVLAGRPVSIRDALGVALRSPRGQLVGALCVAGGSGTPPGNLAPGDRANVLLAFADVLGDQLELLQHVSRLHDDAGAVEKLEAAIDAGQLRPWYQPILRLATRELVGFEALARWHRPTGAVERPGAFIGLAEETGLVTKLDLAVLDHGAADLARWREQKPDLRLNVNISGRHLADDDWTERVHEIVTRHGVPPANIDLELTESARPDDVERGAVQLQRLRDRGYSIWFDDFGTGWSELQHLVQLPLDGLKIDRFFAEALGSRADAVVRALVQAARELGLQTTIEGVSDPVHADRALELGCDFAQGFLWSQPLPAAAVEELLASAEPVFRV